MLVFIWQTLFVKVEDLSVCMTRHIQVANWNSTQAQAAYCFCNPSKMATAPKTTTSSTTRLVWSDKATSVLLEALRDRQSLWNTKSESYKNRNIKKRVSRSCRNCIGRFTWY